MKDLNSHLASQWLSRVMGWGERRDCNQFVHQLWTKHQLCTNTVLHVHPAFRELPVYWEAGCERKRAVTVMSTVECTVWGALGAKGGKGYRLMGSQKASGKKSPWWWPRQKGNVLGRRIGIFKDIEVKITLVRCCIVENSHLLLMCPQKATLENQLEIV